jgi:ubiquinone/menaquinone biosynthesis C-methylase UbiE
MILDKDQPKLPFSDKSVDLLYGISVMTHLTEYNQHRWLREIRRVIKPGGCVILTSNGETQYYKTPELIHHAFVERFGFSDIMADATFGEDLSVYYRVSYQSRDYTKRSWGEYLYMLDIIPAAQSFVQDYVVMRG